jgi:Tol biopolymer transport system component
VRQIVPFSYDVTLKGGEWSPDGERILFSDNAGYSGQTEFTEPQNVWTVDADGTDLRQLTHFHAVPPDVSTGAGSFSPDGRWITFKRVSHGKNTLWKMHPDGGHLTRIIRSRFGFTGAVEWGPR